MIALWIVLALVVTFGVVVFRGAPYVPSLPADIERAFTELYVVGEQDTVVDVGSGDGIVLRHAERRGAQAIGYEINPLLVVISRLLSYRSPNVQVKLADFWLTPLPSSTTLVYAFSVSRDMVKMANKMQSEATRLGRPLYFMSYGSDMKNRPAIKSLGAHHLYEFTPLQEVIA